MNVPQSFRRTGADFLRILDEQKRRAGKICRLKRTIRKEKRTVRTAYLVLGSQYYAQQRGASGCDLDRYCEEIDRAKERISRAREEWQTLSGAAKEKRSVPRQTREESLSPAEQPAQDAAGSPETEKEAGIILCETAAPDLAAAETPEAEPENALYGVPAPESIEDAPEAVTDEAAAPEPIAAEAPAEEEKADESSAEVAQNFDRGIPW